MPAGSSTAPPAAAPSTLAPGDDYQYESYASLVSSIDSELDRLEFDQIYLAKPSDTDVDEDDPDESDDAEFKNDPWNTVCVVGLRVYSKDEGCSIRVVRPRCEAGDEDTQLDIDDASKGVSGEKEGQGSSQGAPGEIEVKTGVGK